MIRRKLLALGGTALLAGGTALLATRLAPRQAVAKEIVPYSREAFDAAMAAGKPLLLDTYASW